MTFSVSNKYMELIFHSVKSSEILYSNESISADELKEHMLNKYSDIYTPLSAAPKMKILEENKNTLNKTLEDPLLTVL